ncbi:MAG: restriction endonuclease subunit S [Porphyromonas sp.]|nr:restriction endonuclease subunit S [Porphyromonas sp.]
MTAKNKTTPWIRLGDYIEECDERNLEGLPLPFYGINKEKTFMPTVADTNQLDNSKYKVVGQGVFVFSGMQTGRDQCIRLALREDKNPVLISPAYTTFRMKDESKLLPEYLFIFFKRKEMDRYGAFLSDGSIRSNLDWDRFCDIRIPLPSIEVQQELVNTYTGLQRLAEENEALIAPLSKACQAFIVDCQKKYPSVELGKYIEECDERNTEGRSYSFLGINKDKTFMPTHANTNELDNTKYKIVSKGIFAFSGMQTGRDICIRIALYDKDKPALVSPAYTTFKIKSPKLLSEYLFLQFKRSEMDRYGWYLSDSSVRSNLDWERFTNIQVPLPPPEVQQSIVNLYHCIEEAKKIASEARVQLQTLCPALIQYAEHN